MSFGTKAFVREEDWQQAVDEYKKVHLLGKEAVAAYVKEKQALADRMPAKMAVSLKDESPGRMHTDYCFCSCMRSSLTGAAPMRHGGRKSCG